MYKSTIWHHVHDVVLTPDTLRQIRSRQGGSSERKAQHLIKATLDAEKLLLSRTKDSVLARAVAMLYWAEGSKRELVFTNTDIAMIRLYVCFLVRCLRVPMEDIFFLIRIADPISAKEAVAFWSQVGGFNLKNIKINHNNIQNKTKTKFGICRVYTKKGAYPLKIIHCIIEALKRELLPL